MQHFKDIIKNLLSLRLCQGCKKGHKGQQQQFLCKCCGKPFVKRQQLDIHQLWQDYIFGKQTLAQYHQVKIVKRYLTSHRELEVSKELLSIIKLLSHSDKESFIGMFEQWAVKWDKFLKERSVDKKTKKSYFVHKKLRSAYHSIKHNMLYLWTFYDFPEMKIPNTNNGLEGRFTDLKTKLRNHNGLSKNHRKLFIDEYFRNSFK